MSPTSKRPDAREKLLDAALSVIRSRGYAAARVDDICTAAGVTKGAFFHHFESKEAMAVAAADYWSRITGALFAGAPYHDQENPLERILAYVDFRIGLITGDTAEYTCLVGTMVQEAYDASPLIRRACEASICGHAETLVSDIEAARDLYHITESSWTARDLALHTQAVLQGAFILAKATGDPGSAIESAQHLRRYLSLLFRSPETKENQP